MKVVGLNWLLVGVSVAVPLLVGLLIAWLLWGGRDTMAGNLAAAGIILLSIFLFFPIEFVEVQRVRQACGEAQVRCVFQPSQFVRYAIYAMAGFLDIMLIFLASLWYESRRRRVVA